MHPTDGDDDDGSIDGWVTDKGQEARDIVINTSISIPLHGNYSWNGRTWKVVVICEFIQLIWSVMSRYLFPSTAIGNRFW